MEDSEFSSEFASSFLNWDDNEDELTVPAPAPNPGATTAHNLQSSVSSLATEGGTTNAPAPAAGYQLPAMNPALNGAAHVQAQQQQQATSNANARVLQQPPNTAAPPQHLMQGTLLPATITQQMLSGNTSSATYAALPQHQMLHTTYTQRTSHPQQQQHPAPAPTAQRTTPPLAAGTTTNMTQAPAPTAHTNGSQTTSPVPVPHTTGTNGNTNTVTATATAATTMKATQLHPLGIQSSANCPPHVTGTLPTMVSTTVPTQPYLPLMYNSLLSGAHGQQMLGLVPTQEPATTAAAPPQSKPPAPPPAPTPAPQLRAHTGAPTVATTTTTTTRRTNSKSKGRSGTSDIPPFYLFDAPVELRTNFLQTQRLHNLPIVPDNNAYHYGMAVNGFHPQLNAQVNPVLPLNTQPALPPGVVQLVDARGKKKGKTGKERNEREQKRAQKITELIEKLRLSMEKGGWKVEIKSKYHTLSTCADYVKHLMKTNKEKEAAVEKAKSDLEMKERKLEEDKALNEARSDPESVASSLTASSARSSEKEDGSEGGARKRKRKSPSSSETDGEANTDKSAKKPKENSSGDSADSSSGEEQGCGSAQNISLDKTTSSVSDITDSNRGSSGGSEQPSSSSISSTAAVARGTSSRDRADGHADVVVRINRHHKNNKKMLGNEEATSMDSNFDLNFEEAFISSNVPQLIATPAGRIIACNDFFLKATGLSRSEIQRLTIFSMVRSDKLSNLFELVAEALRNTNDEDPQNANETGSSSSSSGHTTGASNKSSEASTNVQRRGDYAAMTLPCVSFPSRTRAGCSHHPNPLFMTVTLMTDDDPRKRCFHCVLTDCPGTNGAMGFITPELLAMLFTERIDNGVEESPESELKPKSEIEESELAVDVDGGDLDDAEDQLVEE